MTNYNATPSTHHSHLILSDCQTDAIILHGLVQALEELDGSDTPQAFQGRGALIVIIERLAGKLATSLDDVKVTA